MKDPQQKKFEAHCTDWLNLDVHLPRARSQYRLAYDAELIEYKKHNAGTRAMNLYLLNELKKVGADNWKGEQVTAVKSNTAVRNNTAVKNADKSVVAYKGNGTRPAHLTIKL